jgi:hypothetical protein
VDPYRLGFCRMTVKNAVRPSLTAIAIL